MPKKYINPTCFGNINSKEKNDCSVRAFSNASGRPYEEVHSLLKTLGRADCKGTPWSANFRAAESLNFECIGTFGTTATARYINCVYGAPQHKGMTLENAVKTFNKGRYVGIYRGHAFAIVDGKLIDTFSSPAGKRICTIFKLKETN